MFFDMRGKILKIPASEKQRVVFFMIFIILAHLGLILFPAVNHEFNFVEAAEYFKTHNKDKLDQYFTYQANTLGLPYLASLISFILPWIDLLVLIRLINLMSIPLLIIGIYRISKYLNLNNFIALLLLTIFNPLVWTYSGRATADFLPAALGIFAVSLSLGESRFLLKVLVSGIILGLAAILKYHALSLLVLLGGLLLSKEKFGLTIIKLIVISIVSFSLVLLYVLKVHSLYGFWVTPEKFQAVHSINSSNIINNFILYTGFLGLIALPGFLFSTEFCKIVLDRWKFLVFFLIATAFLTFYNIQDGGELNFGPLDAIVSDNVRVVILSLMFSITCLLIFLSEEKISNINKIKFTQGFSVLLVLLVFSSSRPAQRYLLFALPFFLMLVSNNNIIIQSRMVIPTTIILFIISNSFIELNRWSTGTAANLMAQKLEAENLIEHTQPGAIDGHVGDRFIKSSHSNKNYMIIVGKSNDAIIMTNAGYFFFEKTFSLVKINPESISK